MIDKFFYWLFGIVDAYSDWIDKQFTKPKKKKRKVLSNAWIKKRVKKK
jgi:hypothetical protein